MTARLPNRPALVTGMGILCPVGRSRQEVLDALRQGRSGIDEIAAFDTSAFRTPFGGEVRSFDPAEHLTKAELEDMPDRSLQLALAAARRALEDAGLCWSRDDPPKSRAALVVGTCNGGLSTAEQQYRILLGMQPGRFDRKMNLLIRYHTMGKALSYALGVTGPTWVVTTACSSSTTALGLAFELVSRGAADVVLAGGADAMCLATMAGFDALKATSTGRTAPFSTSVGLNLGEGAAFWVVESPAHASARGARVDGELQGYALSADAHHPTAPDPRGDGAYRTMSAAIESAGVDIGDIGAINAHGTGTDANDRTETKAVLRLCGAKSIPVYSFKSQVGHCLGAAGAVEATAGLLAMQNDLIPATCNFGEARPGCGLDYVPNTPRPAHYDRFVSSNYAFGGNNASIIVGRHHPGRPVPEVTAPEAPTALTGAGAVCSLGLDLEPLLEGLHEGRRGLVPVAGRVPGATRARLAGLVPPFSERHVDRRLDLRNMNSISRYATAAARFALKHCGARVGPREGAVTGIVSGVYVGPEEEGQMQAVIPTGGACADIAGFSQIVANATAGWVSNALLLKGYSTTVAQGADAGLFALLLAHFAVSSGRARRLLAGAADELYPRYFQNYDGLGLLHKGADEQSYGLRPSARHRRVLGEGAAYIAVETKRDALERGAPILAELRGFGMTTDTQGFHEPNRDPAGLARAIDEALVCAGWSPADVELVLWTPQGNSGDLKLLEGLSRSLGAGPAERLPLVTSVFHTGLGEASSGTVTLAAVLAAWSEGRPLWKQITGLSDIDQRRLPTGPVRTLVIASSELGFNLALALEPGGAS